jgi:hypothetical protein
MGKKIELGVTIIDRGVEPAVGSGAGFMSWDEDDLAAGATVLSPLDPRVLILLKAYIAQHEAELKALSAKIK